MTNYTCRPTRSGNRPRAYYLGADYEDSITADEVIDSGSEGDTETGLVNADGRPIYRARETVKFGFVP